MKGNNRLIMAFTLRKYSTDIFLESVKRICLRDSRSLSSLQPNPKEVLTDKRDVDNETRGSTKNVNFRHIYPEFLPDPKPEWRNSLREKLERLDMLNRRTCVDIPEFYVGSILSVTSSDPHAQGKVSRFVGICLERKGCGLRAEFTLRNVVNHQGIEIRYEQYDPTIQKIQVLRLEKRLDDKLFYLRDALPEYNTFDFNMEQELLPEGAEVPVNPIQVKLKPKPWLERWERQELKGVSNIEENLKPKDIIRRKLREKPYEKFDLMKEYRKTIPEEEQTDIWSEVYSQLHNLELTRKKMARKRTFTAPKWKQNF